MIKGKYFVSTRFGSWIFLSREEFLKLARMEIDDSLLEKLEKDGIIMTEGNAKSIISGFVSLNRNLYLPPSLHIMVLSSTCNYNCIYCHAHKESGEKNMSKETAIKILDYIFKRGNKALSIELQGGEPLINWETAKFVISQARELNKIEGKDLRISLVSNLSLLDGKKVDFLVKNKVGVCTSLDGPKEIHDKNRKSLAGNSTNEITVEKIKELKEKYGKRNERLVTALPTITRHSLGHAKEIIDEYVRLGMKSVHIRNLLYLGAAKKDWKEIAYSPDEFIEFWKECMEYILELNEKGVGIEERTAKMICSKILKKQDPLYTEMMSPCGAGRAQLLYTEDGGILTCDDARDLDGDIFKIGSVDMPYEEVLGSEKNMNIWQSSLLDLYDPSSPYIAFAGVCPVQSLSHQKNVIPKIKQNFGYTILEKQIDWVLEKISEGKRETFIKWFSN